jgi:hypothetical protein
MQSGESHAFSTAIGDGTARLDPHLNTLIVVRAILTVNPSAARRGKLVVPFSHRERGTE